MIRRILGRAVIHAERPAPWLPGTPYCATRQKRWPVTDARAVTCKRCLALVKLHAPDELDAATTERS